MEYQMPLGEKILIYSVYFAPLVLAFICGSVIGSLSNVVIHRLPKGRSLWKPPSHCPSCETRIAWYDNIPIYSWLRLRAKCRHCAAPISARYIIVEFLSGAFYVIVLYVFGYVPIERAAHPGDLPNLSNFSWTIVPLLAKAYIFTSILLILSFIDIDIKKLPNRLTFPGMIIGFILAFVVFPEGPQVWRPGGFSFETIGARYLDSFLGWLLGGGVLFLLVVISSLIYKKAAMGLGDVKLIAMIGAFVGWKATIAALFCGFLAGGIFGILLIIMKIATRKTFIPFGPYLALGGFIAMLYGKSMAWIYYTSFYQKKPLEVALDALAQVPHYVERIISLFA